jgi:hypothetical protein
VGGADGIMGNESSRPSTSVSRIIFYQVQAAHNKLSETCMPSIMP